LLGNGDKGSPAARLLYSYKELQELNAKEEMFEQQNENLIASPNLAQAQRITRTILPYLLNALGIKLTLSPCRAP